MFVSKRFRVVTLAPILAVLVSCAPSAPEPTPTMSAPPAPSASPATVHPVPPARTPEQPPEPSGTPEKAKPTKPSDEDLEAEQDALFEERFDQLGRDAIGGAGSALSLGRRYCGKLQAAFPDADDPAAANYLADDRFVIETVSHDLAIEVFCPEFMPALEASGVGTFGGGFGTGEWVVGEDVRPGTYATAPRVTDCYWEITDANGRIVANDLVSLAPKGVIVTVKKGQGFVTQGCGGWLPVD